MPGLGPHEHYLNLPLQQPWTQVFSLLCADEHIYTELREGVSLIQGHTAGKWQSFSNSRDEALTPSMGCPQRSDQGSREEARGREARLSFPTHSPPPEVLPDQGRASEHPVPRHPFLLAPLLRLWHVQTFLLGPVSQSVFLNPKKFPKSPLSTSLKPSLRHSPNTTYLSHKL